MSDWRLPYTVGRIGTPPLKSQGIKTKLVPFIAQSIEWIPGNTGRWIEPFLGTGCVALNVAPPRALLADINPHVIGVLRAVQADVLTPTSVRASLHEMGAELSRRGEEYYYEVRSRFNETGESIDFLFLNRASFNGIIRFSKRSGFNTPFGHKPERFSTQFLSKVANQVAWARERMMGKDWVFAVQDWRETIAAAGPEDFIYLDPPYIGRNADYFSQWSDHEATSLAHETLKSPAGFALSMWLENEHRKNDHIEERWGQCVIRTAAHFYHVGASQSQRKPMIEALAIRPGYETRDQGIFVTGRSLQSRMDDAIEPLFV